MTKIKIKLLSITAIILLGINIGTTTVYGINITEENSSSQLSCSRVATGGWHTVALKSDGTVWTWGNNNVGQLGDGSINNSNTPIQVQSSSEQFFSGVKNIAAGGLHTVALKSNGTVWTWGDNSFGQLGIGVTNTIPNPYPSLIHGDALSGTVSAIAAGMSHTVVLEANGTVWAWGSNIYGQLGDGTTIDRDTPVRVKSSSGRIITGIKAITAGDNHTALLKDDGTVWTFGCNYDGQLGNGVHDKNSHTTAGQVQGLSGVTAVRAGQGYTTSLKSNGTVWSWGDNTYGELGNGGDSIGSDVPVQALGITGVSTLGGGSTYTVALSYFGEVWAWGDNTYGELGIGSNNTMNVPTPVETPAGKVLTAVANGACNIHTVAIQDNGKEVWAWGDNRFGQLGIGDTVNKNMPVMVQGFVNN